jgi:ABC-type uncharacterized transport system auxiliary subunit
MKLRLPGSLGIPFAAMLVLTGCGPSRYARSYVLSFPAPSPALKQAVDIGTLAIDEFECPQYLCEGRIVYRSSPEEIGFYEFHRWAANPREMLTRFVADRVRSAALFKSVALRGSRVDATYVMKGTIEHLEEVDQGQSVSVVCTISAQLVQKQTRSVVWSKTVSQTLPVQNRTVAGVVSSLSAAAGMTVDAMVQSLQATLSPASAE